MSYRSPGLDVFARRRRMFEQAAEVGAMPEGAHALVRAEEEERRQAQERQQRQAQAEEDAYAA